MVYQTPTHRTHGNKQSIWEQSPRQLGADLDNVAPGAKFVDLGADSLDTVSRDQSCKRSVHAAALCCESTLLCYPSRTLAHPALHGPLLLPRSRIANAPQVHIFHRPPPQVRSCWRCAPDSRSAPFPIQILMCSESSKRLPPPRLRS